MIPIFHPRAQITPAVEAMAAKVMLAARMRETGGNPVPRARPKYQKAPSDEILARRADVRKWHAKGLYVHQIAEAMGCCEATVKNDAAAMGLRFGREARRRADERRRKVAELIAEGATLIQIAVALGVNRNTIAADSAAIRAGHV